MNNVGKIIQAVPDLIGALLLSIPFILYMVLFFIKKREGSPSDSSNRLLVFDTSYTLKTLRTRDQMHTILSRDLDGFFDHVVTVHPLVGADPREPDSSATGKIRKESLTGRHTVIENPVRPSRLGKGFPRTSFLWNQWRLLRALHRLVREERMDVVRIGDPHYQGLLGYLLARRNRIPLVVRVGGNLDAIYKQTGQLAYPRILPTKRVEKAVERFVLKRADLVVGANQDNLDYAIRNGADRARTSVFRYGNLVAPIHFTDPSARIGGPESLRGLGIDIERPVLVYVGRLEPVKHVQDLIKIHATVVEQRPGVQLLIVGDGTERQTMEDQVKRFATGANVFFAGDRDQEWIARVVPHTDLVMATQMGRALVETALAGVPVVAYHHDWHAEITQDGRHGHLVPFGDQDAFAKAVIQILERPGQTRRMGRVLRRDTYELMHPDRLNAHERGVYRAVLGLPSEVAPIDRAQEAVHA